MSPCSWPSSARWVVTFPNSQVPEGCGAAPATTALPSHVTLCKGPDLSKSLFSCPLYEHLHTAPLRDPVRMKSETVVKPKVGTQQGIILCPHGLLKSSVS